MEIFTYIDVDENCRCKCLCYALQAIINTCLETEARAFTVRRKNCMLWKIGERCRPTPNIVSLRDPYGEVRVKQQMQLP